MNITPRNGWCTTPRRSTPASIPTPSRDLWLHHGATGTSSIATANAYARYHIQTLGWQDVGYSFLIAAGRVLEGRGAGRSGAHTRNHNTTSHGIVVCGDYTSRAPSDRDLDALVWLIRHGRERGWWPAVLSGGHRDAPNSTPTSCPGNTLHRLIPELNRRATTRPRRYSMVIYARRGTPDAHVAAAVHDARPSGVVTFVLAEARAALDRGEKVVAVGGPAADQLGSKAVRVVGSNAADTARRLAVYAGNGWK